MAPVMNRHSNLPSLEIVIPCYNEEEALPVTIDKIDELIRELVDEKLVSSESSALLVDDGSEDTTWDLIVNSSREGKAVRGVRLTRNVGQQFALLAGLEAARADLILTIDADLQDDISVIPEMIRKARNGKDVVYGIRKDRSTDTWFKRKSSGAYYRLRSLLGVEAIGNHAEFRLMSETAVDKLLQYPEANMYLRGLVPLVGHDTDTVYYKRQTRVAGETKYSIGKLVALAVDGVTSFSAVPLRLIAGLGFAVFVLSVIMSFWVLWQRLVADTAVPGWASSVLPVFFLGGVQLLCLGVIGEYVSKIYGETKRRPRYFVEATVERADPAKQAGHGRRSA